MQPPSCEVAQQRGPILHSISHYWRGSRESRIIHNRENKISRHRRGVLDGESVSTIPTVPRDVEKQP